MVHSAIFPAEKMLVDNNPVSLPDIGSTSTQAMMNNLIAA
jgi:hypothetical protein